MRRFLANSMSALAAVSVLISGCSFLENSKLLGYPGAVKLTGPIDPVGPSLKAVSPISATAKPAVTARASVPHTVPVTLPSEAKISPPVPPIQTAPPRQPAVAAPQIAAPRALAASQPSLRYRNETLSEDMHWSGEVLVEGGVTVAPQATLTIDPGTVVRFGESNDSAGTNSVLLVFGRLVVAGTADKPVLLTSRFAEPRPSDWQGIVFMGSEKKNSIENCRIVGAVAGLNAAFSSLTVRNTVFSLCAAGAKFMDSLVSMSGGGPLKCGTGIVASDSEVDLRDSEVKGNRQGIFAVRTSLSVSAVLFAGNESEALKATSSRVKILNNSFEMNGAGMLLVDTEGTVSYNKIRENVDYGVSLQKDRLKITGNDITSNGHLGMHVDECNCAIWNNAFLANGTADFSNAGAGDIMAIGNWWGAGAPVEIEKHILDHQHDAARGRVVIIPVLAGNPLTP